MEETNVDEHCMKCSGGIDSTMCQKCDKCFCRNHFVDHEQSINEELNRIDEKFNSFDINLREQDLVDTLHERIEQWEKTSINKIQDMAARARTDLATYFIKPHNQLKDSFKKVQNEIASKRKLNNFKETELKEWGYQLNRLQELLEQLRIIKIVDEDQWQPVIRVIPSESFTKSQVEISKLETLFASTTLSIDVKIDNINFENQAKAMAMNAAEGNSGVSAPLRGCLVEIPSYAKWDKMGRTVAGGYGKGRRLNQLSHPYGLYVSNDFTIYVADSANNRIVQWKHNSAAARVVAGGNGRGSDANQLNFPNDVILDEEQDCLIISDRGNRRVVRWSCRNASAGTTIISNIDSIGVTMDENGDLYIADHGRHEVKKYSRDNSNVIVVAGGKGKGTGLDQLSSPGYIFVDRKQSVYVSEWDNNRVTRWDKGATQGVIVAGGNGQGPNDNQLSRPLGIIVDQKGTVYVADTLGDRVMRWLEGSSSGDVIIGGNTFVNDLNRPEALSFDQYGNIYVVDKGNSRVQKFNIV